MIKKSLLLLAVLSAIASADYKQSYLYYINAQLLISESKYAEAVEELKKTIAVDPEALIAYRDMAMCYLKLGEVNSAIKTADEIAKKFNNPDSYKFLAWIYFVTSSFKEAAYYYEKVLETEPSNDEALIYLANYYHTINPKDALKYWDKIAARKPGDPEVYLKIAEAYEKMKLYETAIKNYTKSLEIDPSFKEVHLALSKIYEILKDTPAAVAEYKKYLKEDPENIAVLNYLGALYFSNNDIENAEEIFKRVVQISTLSASGYIWLGIISAEKKDIDGAISNFEKAVKIDPSAAVYQYLSELHIQKKDYKTAKIYLEKAIKLNPRDHKLKFLAGLLYMDQKKYAKAIRYFADSLKLKPDLYDAYFYSAISYDNINDFKSARKLLEELISMNPEHSQALNYLSYSLADRNTELEYAMRLVTKALEIEPQNPAYIDTLGWIYYRQEKFEAAEKEIGRAAEKARDWEIFYHLGIIKEKLAKYREAYENYVASFYFNPKHKEKKEMAKRMDKISKKLDKTEILSDIAGRILSFHSDIKSIEGSFIGKMGNSFIWGEISFLYPDDLILSIGTGVFPVYFRLKDKLSTFPYEDETLPKDFINYAMQNLKRVFSGEVFSNIKTANIIEFSNKKIKAQKDTCIYDLDSRSGILISLTDNDFKWKFKDYKVVNHAIKLPETIYLEKNKTKIMKLKLKKLKIPHEKDKD